MIMTALITYLNYVHGANIPWTLLILTILFDLITAPKIGK